MGILKSDLEKVLTATVLSPEGTLSVNPYKNFSDAKTDFKIYQLAFTVPPPRLL